MYEFLQRDVAIAILFALGLKSRIHHLALLIRCRNFGNETLQRNVSTLVLKSRIHHFHAPNWATPKIVRVVS